MFDKIVLEGLLLPNGMPRWDDAAEARPGQGDPRLPDRRAGQGPRARAGAAGSRPAARFPQPDYPVELLDYKSDTTILMERAMIPEGVIDPPSRQAVHRRRMGRREVRQDDLEIVNPNSEEVVARVAEAGNEDMDRAVAAAREAFDNGPWSTTPPAERGAALMPDDRSSRSARARTGGGVDRAGRRPRQLRADDARRLGRRPARDRGAGRELRMGLEPRRAMVRRYRDPRARAGRRGRRRSRRGTRRSASWRTRCSIRWSPAARS